MGLFFPEVPLTTTATLEALVSNTANRGGKRLSTYAGKLFLRPRDPDFNPAIYFFNAIPFLPDESEVPYNLVENWGLPVLFQATPDSDLKVCKIGNTTVIGT